MSGAMVRSRTFQLAAYLLLAALAPATGQDVGPTAPAQANFASEPSTPPTPPCPISSEPCGPRGPSGLHAWASVDYTFGWVSGASSPPLFTATPVGGGPPVTLFGDRDVNGGVRSGIQLRGGLWLDEAGTCGIEAGMLNLCSRSQHAAFGDTPGMIIARPFINATTGLPDAELVSFPGVLSGNGGVDAKSSGFCAADIGLRKLICCDGCGRLDCVVGYRFLSFDDEVRIHEDLRPTVAPFPPGSRIRLSDSFEAENRFHGLLIALAGEYRVDAWYVQGRAGVSVGRTFRRATISGATEIETPPDPPVVQPGGLLALPSNSGRHSSSDWACVPEVSIRVGCWLTENLRIYVGYTALYWPAVYRAADQIDLTINPGLLPPPEVPLTGPVRPVFPDRLSSLGVHAISFGLECRY
jgi:hypothetical protein